MFADIIWFPKQGSTTAHQVDYLLIALVTVTGAVSLLVAFLLIYFSVRYRRRPNAPPPPEVKANFRLELFWTLTPLAIFMGFFVWGAKVYFAAYRAPDDALVIYVTGKQWMWQFQHPGGQREKNELHIPVGKPIKLVMTSEDVIHSFYVPEFRVHMDVLPGRYTSVWFEAAHADTYKLFCSQYCGTNHAGMIGQVIAMKPADYDAWLRSKAEGSKSLEGGKVFLKYRCLSCHSADEHARAPVLEDLYLKRVVLRDGSTVIADDDYIRESILDPGAKIVAGYKNIMPTFKGQVTEQELIELVAFIRSLHHGQTPRRVEQYPPPVSTPSINPKGSKQ
jgi:cytochrome c oxidase subunit 2